MIRLWKSPLRIPETEEVVRLRIPAIGPYLSDRRFHRVRMNTTLLPPRPPVTTAASTPHSRQTDLRGVLFPVELRPLHFLDDEDHPVVLEPTARSSKRTPANTSAWWARALPVPRVHGMPSKRGKVRTWREPLGLRSRASCVCQP